MITETNLTVRYAETDQMGIVHHSVYPIWFESARTDFLKQAGIVLSRHGEKRTVDAPCGDALPF